MTFQDTFRHLFLSGVISLQNTYFHVYFALKNEIRFSDLIVTAVWPLCEGGEKQVSSSYLLKTCILVRLY
jgi:hypothetical protein